MDAGTLGKAGTWKTARKQEKLKLRVQVLENRLGVFAAQSDTCVSTDDET